MTEKSMKEKLSTGAKWLRLVFMILFGIIGWVLECIICIIAIFQFIYSLFTDGPLESLQPFSDSLSKYVYQIVQFLTYVTEEKPFPFSSWPPSEHKPAKKPVVKKEPSLEKPKKPAEKPAEKPTEKKGE